MSTVRKRHFGSYLIYSLMLGTSVAAAFGAVVTSKPGQRLSRSILSLAITLVTQVVAWAAFVLLYRADLIGGDPLAGLLHLIALDRWLVGSRRRPLCRPIAQALSTCRRDSATVPEHLSKGSRLSGAGPFESEMAASPIHFQPSSSLRHRQHEGSARKSRLLPFGADCLLARILL